MSPAFFVYRKEVKLLAESNQKVIKDTLLDVMSSETPKVIQKRVNTIVKELESYLQRLNNFYARVEDSAKTVLEIYDNEIKANEITTTYSLYKELKGYDTEAFEILKEGYIMIDDIRTFFTGEKIVYDIGFTYKNTLYEIPMTMEEILQYTKADYNTKSKVDNLFKLRMAVSKGKLVEAYNNAHRIVDAYDDGSSTIQSSISRYLKEKYDRQVMNQGNVYEAYKVYKATVGSNRIPPAEFKSTDFDDILTQVRKNTAASTKGGDYLSTQIKFISSAPSLMTTSTVRTTLNQVLNIFISIRNGDENQTIIEQVKKIFIKTADQVASKEENNAREKAEEYAKNVIMKLDIQ